MCILRPQFQYLPSDISWVPTFVPGCVGWFVVLLFCKSLSCKLESGLPPDAVWLETELRVLPLPGNLPSCVVCYLNKKLQDQLKLISQTCISGLMALIFSKSFSIEEKEREKQIITKEWAYAHKRTSRESVSWQ